jgi:hypothetical protein
MQPISTVEGRAYPLGLKNVDTDIIIPAEWLKTISRTGLGKGAFQSLRAVDGNVFDDPEFTGSPILIAGDNFGCGSSREHAHGLWPTSVSRRLLHPAFPIFSRAMRSKTDCWRLCCPRPRLTGCWKLQRPIRSISIWKRRRNDAVSGPVRIRDRPFSQALPAGRCRRDRLDAGKQRRNRQL